MARPSKAASGPQGIPQEKISISVVVPTYRRPHLLLRCLETLCAQNYDPDAYEVIVVDNAGCSVTRRMVEGFDAGRRGAGPSVRYLLAVESRGPAAARNCGWLAARGKIIAFTDDDCLPAPDWLRAGAAAFANGEVGVMGNIVVPVPSAPTDYELTVAQLGNSEFATANCFYRRDALKAAGGFDERFTAAWREDSDLYFTLLKGIGNDPFSSPNFRFGYAPEAIVCHPSREVSWGVSLTQQRKSMYNALLFKKHPDHYRAQIQSSPPWRYYRALLALLGGGIALIRGRTRPAAVMLVLWAVLTGRFAGERLRHTSRAPQHVAEMVVTSALIPPLSVFWRLVGAIKFRVFFL